MTSHHLPLIFTALLLSSLLTGGCSSSGTVCSRDSECPSGTTCLQGRCEAPLQADTRPKDPDRSGVVDRSISLKDTGVKDTGVKDTGVGDVGLDLHGDANNDANLDGNTLIDASSTEASIPDAGTSDLSLTPPLVLTPGMVVSPMIAATNAKLTTGAASSTFLDAPINALGSDTWLNSHSQNAYTLPDTVRHIMTQGSQDDPYATVHWAKPTCQRNSNQFCVDQTSGTHAFISFGPGLTDVVQLWFTSVYNAGGAERLAFIHEENAGYTGFTPANWEGRCRIGLAYSADSGNTWRYLGRIVIPHVDSGDTRRQNIMGTPYVIHGGEFYIWYNDYNGTSEGLNVSKARVADVLTAARAGNVGANLWLKKSPSGWNSDIQSAPAFPTGVYGINHTQAAYSSFTGKFYSLLTSMTWAGTNTYVNLYEFTTPDGPWTLAGSIVDEPGDTNGANSGYQYCSLTDPDGDTNATITTSMNVICRKVRDSVQPYHQALYSWRVYLLDLGADFYRLSKDYSDTQGVRSWTYFTTESDALTWNGTWWSDPTETYNRIYRPGPGAAANFSPGMTRGARLAWTAPKSGNIFVRALPRSSQPTPGCGDGVVVTYKAAGVLRFTGAFAWNDTVGGSILDTMAVTSGQTLEFLVEKNGNNFCDNLFLDPTIGYY